MDKQIKVVCAEQALGLVGCENPCGCCFSENDRSKNIGRMMIRAIRESCPMFKGDKQHPRLVFPHDLIGLKQEQQTKE